jgi:hypothetical protein
MADNSAMGLAMFNPGHQSGAMLGEFETPRCYEVF